jgi:Flp pilus assembly protein CpaB
MAVHADVSHVRISRDLKEAEFALNEALLKQCSLLTSMMHARKGETGNPFLGQEAVARLVRSQQSLLTASGDLARVHGRLREIAQEQGRVIHECPPNEPTGSITEELVAAA